MGEFHPIQTHEYSRPARKRHVMPEEVTRRAYEVYCELWHVDLAGRDCRGGFGVGELIALLYARTFPKTEWRQRFDEAIKRPL